MTISPKTIVLALAASTTLILGFSLSSTPPVLSSSPRPFVSSSPSFSYESQTSEGGNVTVSVTPITLRPGFPASFDVALETHSVELDFDVEQIAALTTNNLQPTTFKPTWQGAPPGGHHRSGTLIFTPDLAKTNAVTLTLINIAGIEKRTFTWEIQP